MEKGQENVLLDLNATFDTITLSILTDIFTHFFNKTSTCKKLFKSYLNDRT